MRRRRPPGESARARVTGCLSPHHLFSGPWVADLKRAVAAAGAGDSAGEDTLKALAQLQRAESAEAAKAAYVLAVEGLGSWAAATGLASKLKGL